MLLHVLKKTVKSTQLTRRGGRGAGTKIGRAMGPDVMCKKMMSNMQLTTMLIFDVAECDEVTNL